MTANALVGSSIASGSPQGLHYSGTLPAGLESPPSASLAPQSLGSRPTSLDAGHDPFGMGGMATALPGMEPSTQGFAPGYPPQAFGPGPSPRAAQASQFYPYAAPGGYGNAPHGTGYAPPSHTPSPPSHGVLSSSPYFTQQYGAGPRGQHEGPTQLGFVGSTVYAGQQAPGQPPVFYPQGYGTMAMPQQAIQGGWTIRVAMRRDLHCRGEQAHHEPRRLGPDSRPPSRQEGPEARRDYSAVA